MGQSNAVSTQFSIGLLAQWYHSVYRYALHDESTVLGLLREAMKLSELEPAWGASRSVGVQWNNSIVPPPIQHLLIGHRHHYTGKAPHSARCFGQSRCSMHIKWTMQLDILSSPQEEIFPIPGSVYAV
ncbi:hypothetical protein IAQ61_009639 [Plenodomus lingam]|uniref:uncharacterized protein n=1 Tax=Leptosphaeria maculans TaxID=5022 RepID=UPI003318A1CF|nr:hypothetical protein IAQ61_009639 [Plenodomus lingam]